MTKYISVWCEYDISGSFGGNNNEDIFEVDTSLEDDQIETLVVSHVTSKSGVNEYELDGLYGWSHIDIQKLKESK